MPESRRCLWLGRTLLGQGWVTEDQLRKGLEVHANSGEGLGQVLVDLGFVSREQVRQAVARQLGMKPVDLDAAEIPAPVIGKVPAAVAWRLRAVPVSLTDGVLTVAMADPLDARAVGRLRALAGCAVKAAVSDERAVAAALARFYGPEPAEARNPDGEETPAVPGPRPARRRAPEDDPVLGRTLGSCRVTGRLGEGGMGVVYRAEHVALGRAVAVKVLHAELAREAEFVERFAREARAASRLDHPNIVRVLGSGREGRLHFIVMECVEGRTLAERLGRVDRLPVREALDIAAQVAGALAAAHRLGIVHRDIKPGNVLLAAAGRVKVADFGLARNTLDPEHRLLAEDSLGTPSYMAPEQAEGRAVDGRADLYSLGVMLYEMLSGQLPFAGRTLEAIARQRRTAGPSPLLLAAPDVPADLAGLVMGLLAEPPAERCRSAEEVLTGLEHAAAALAAAPER